jgi:hypothetical protein
MASRKGRRTRLRSIEAARSTSSNTPTAERADVNANNTVNATPQAFEFECALCGAVKGRANISARTGEWVISCWSCSQGSYLFDLADFLKVPGGGYTLKEDPERYLAPCIKRRVRTPNELAPLPSEQDIRAWCRMRRNDPDVMHYLLAERSLNKRVVERARLGYDGRAITIPIYDVQTRKLVNLRRRYWPNAPASGGKYQGLTGRTIGNGGVTVYPTLPDGSVILVAGEFDALVLWSHGLPGITVTSGAATRWRREWAWMVKGRRVAVIYDADPREQEQAISRAAELRREGAEAWPVRLTEAGLSDGEDVTDWFVKYGRTKADLLSLIKRERGQRRRRAKR